MITKTFLKIYCDTVWDIEEMVTKKLVRPHYFLISNGVAYLRTSRLDQELTRFYTLDMCQVPLNLHRAIEDGTATSFSVTLPARYWV